MPGDGCSRREPYTNAILVNTCGSSSTLTVILDRKYTRLTGVAGIPDDADDDYPKTLYISVDNGRELLGQEIRYGEPFKIDLQLGRSLKLTLRVAEYCSKRPALADMTLT
jgi:hypothetical protein